MLHTIRRVAFAAAPALVALVAACSDSTNDTSLPSAPLPPDVVSIGGASALRGTVITRARHLDGGPSLGRVLAADTSEYLVPLRPTGPGAIYLKADDGSLEASASFASASTPRQSGAWTVTMRGVGNAVRYSAQRGAPPSEAEYVQHGSVVARVASEWEPIQGGWRLVSRRVTLLREGQPTDVIEYDYSAPTTSPLSLEEGDALRLASSRSAVRSKPGAGASFDADNGGGGAPCSSEYDAAMNAFYAYWAACAWALETCGSGQVFGCIKAGVAIAGTMSAVNRLCDRFDACLAAI
jgi:hypothetical protein